MISRFAILVAVLAVVSHVLAFSPASRNAALSFRPPLLVVRSWTSSLSMSENPGSDVEVDTSTEVDKESSEVTHKKKKKKKGGLAVVPLFFKLLIVLAVKFVTDVLVYPPLLLWRVVRNTYKQLSKIIDKFSKGTGGESSAASS